MEILIYSLAIIGAIEVYKGIKYVIKLLLDNWLKDDDLDL